MERNRNRQGVVRGQRQRRAARSQRIEEMGVETLRRFLESPPRGIGEARLSAALARLWRLEQAGRAQERQARFAVRAERMKGAGGGALP